MRSSKETAPSIAWLLCLGVVLALFGVHAGKHWNYTVDDAGISFAYAKNVALGNGLVMTPGAERVEAATNLLWCLVLVPAHWIGDKHELLSKVLGLAGVCGALVGMAMFPSVAYRRRPRFFDLVAPLALTTMPHVALWSVSGLENGFFAGLSMGALVSLAHEENEPDAFPWSAVWLVAMFATRPDGILYLGAFGLAKLTRQLSVRLPRQDILWGAILIVGIGGIELFRLVYFAWPWPNSFYTKKRTFNFGKDLFDFKHEGWVYVGRFLQQYDLAKVLFATPLVLIGKRTSSVARIAILASVAVGFFFPIYSHGDWMHEFRFMTFVMPFLLLAVTEGVRGVAQFVQYPLPKSVRPYVALALTLWLGHRVLKETTKNFPDRIEKVGHDTLDIKWVQGRARYFVAAAKRLNLPGRPSLLDPDVGGSSYDGRLDVVDLFGLGDIPIARNHPDNPPGLRDSVFWERAPSFIHLHGAWFGAVEFHRLEEIELGYLRLPPGMPEGESEPDANWVRRDLVAAPWFSPAESVSIPEPDGGMWIDGFTVSHHAVDPNGAVAIELSVVRPEGTNAGVIAVVGEGAPAGSLGVGSVNVASAGGILSSEVFLPGERPRARVTFSAPRAGRYSMVWRRPDGREVYLGPLEVAPGASVRESNALRWNLDQAIRDGHDEQAWSIARRAQMRAWVQPSDSVARAAVVRWGVLLAERAQKLGQNGAPRIASLLARSALLFTGHAREVQQRTGALAELFAEQARDAEKASRWYDSFVLARESVLVDARRSWSRRRAEALRGRVLTAYDGGRDQAAYRYASGARNKQVPLDRAIVLMGTTERWAEAAQLADRVGGSVTDPRARVVVAKGYLALGRVNDALGMVAGVPCASAHDVEVTRGLRALLGREPRPGESGCDAGEPEAPAPFDATTGSFESASFGLWTVEGDAFGKRPAHEAGKGFGGNIYLNQALVNGWRGWHFANSYSLGKDAAKGLLRSPAFVVPAEYESISFLIGGGHDDEHLGVRLVVDGAVVAKQSGFNHEGLRRVFWDVRPWMGHTAVLEVFDDSEGGWGHIMVDDFRLESVFPLVPPPEAPGPPPELPKPVADTEVLPPTEEPVEAPTADEPMAPVNVPKLDGRAGAH